VADDTSAEQPFLIPGFYRCDDCGAVVEHLLRNRRFRLCDACYERIVPDFPPGTKIEQDSPEHMANRAYWEWFGEINERVPRRSEPGHAARTRHKPGRARTADEYFPLCECGQSRVSYRPMLTDADAPRGLFGGPFARECPECNARREVESMVKATSWLHPDWDDEEWLDLLWRAVPEAFEVGVLPDYWFELRRPGITKPAAEPEIDPVARRPRRARQTMESNDGTDVG